MRKDYIQIDYDTLYKMYHIEKKTLYQISVIFDCSQQTILNRMKEFKIPRRNEKEAAKLVIRTQEWNSKIGKSNLGRKLSDSSKEKMQKAAIGRKSSLKGLRKHTHPDLVSWGNQKEKHWNWKGGISKENTLIRQSSKYKSWRDEVFYRDNFTCVFCKNRGGELEADHIKPFSLFPELRFDIDNGRTLCKSCHKIVTKEQRKSLT